MRLGEILLSTAAVESGDSPGTLLNLIPNFAPFFFLFMKKQCQIGELRNGFFTRNILPELYGV